MDIDLPMKPSKKRTAKSFRGISIRTDDDLELQLDKLALTLSKPGERATRTYAARIALAKGLAALLGTILVACNPISSDDLDETSDTIEDIDETSPIDDEPETLDDEDEDECRIHNDCPYSQWCNAGGHCEPRNGLDGFCSEDRMCKPATGETGEMDGLYCDPETSTCRPETEAMPCELNQECGPGSYCDVTDTKTCRLDESEGAFCLFDSSCQMPLLCDDTIHECKPVTQ